MTWREDSTWERSWWGDCRNTYGEEAKQLVYAKRMGLRIFHDGKSPFNIDMGGASVLDVGGGPVSLLLKCHNLRNATVVDPCRYPAWVYARYTKAGITVMKRQAENVPRLLSFDEAWCYNVLQHTEDPARVVANMRRWARVLRVFEWVGTDITPGHGHAFTAEALDAMFGGEGKTEVLNGEGTCVGLSWYGVFKGERYAEV